MKTILFILAILPFLFGVMILFVSTSAIHEIEALLLFLIFAVLFSGAGIIDAISPDSKKENDR